MPVEILIVVLILIAVIAILLFISLPKLLYAKEDIKVTYVNLDAILKERWTLIPKYIEAVKPYSANGLGILEEIILLRNTTFENMKFMKKVETDRELNNRIIEMDLKIREYVELRDDEKLNDVLSTYDKLGKDLEEAKLVYNASIDKLNKLTSRFPTNLVALVAGFAKVKKL